MVNHEQTDQLRQEAAKEILRRRRALDDLGAFREYMADTHSVDFEHPPARHHQLIMEKLEKLERGEIQRLLILAPPGSAKSTYCSIQYPLWRLARQPNRNILCASNTQDLAENFNRRRRNIALAPEWMTLAQTKLAGDLQGAGHFGTEREGGIKAAGVGSAIVGFRSHLNILDDPIRNHEEAFSATALEKQWDWYHSDFRSRLVPGSPELIVSTRWAKKDIAGRFLDAVKEGKEQWTVLRLPMLADSDSDPLGRALGESLWPDWFGPKFIAEKQQNVLHWSTQYQQTPLDESGSWVGNEHIHYTDHQPSGEPHRIIAIDLALSVGKGDWTVFVVGQLDADRRLHIIHVERARIGPDESVDKLFDLCWIYQPREVLADDDNATKVFKAAVHERLRQPKQGQHPFALHLLPMRGKDKETRAAAIRAMFLRGDVRLLKASWTATLVKELVEFPSGDHDDQVDALGLIGRRYPMLSAPAKPRNETDIREKMLILPGNEGHYLMQGGLDEMFEARERKYRRMGNRV
jgi:predicted phage terminase large subunit-like protein